MKRIVAFLILLIGVTCFACSCGTTRSIPITGRKHTLLVADAQTLSLSNEEYSKYMETAKLSTNNANAQMVRRVGGGIWRMR